MFHYSNIIHALKEVIMSNKLTERQRTISILGLVFTVVCFGICFGLCLLGLSAASVIKALSLAGLI